GRAGRPDEARSHALPASAPGPGRAPGTGPPILDPRGRRRAARRRTPSPPRPGRGGPRSPPALSLGDPIRNRLKPPQRAHETAQHPAVKAGLGAGIEPGPHRGEPPPAATARVVAGDLHPHQEPGTGALASVGELLDPDSKRSPAAPLARDEQPALDPPHDLGPSGPLSIHGRPE